MPLSDTGAKNAKPKDKPYKLADERGLYLLVNAGGKYWRFDYRFGGKRKTLALGVYPDVSLRDARNRRDDARKQIAQDIDPGAARKAEKASKAGADSFESIAREWHAKQVPAWTTSNAEKIMARFENDLFPWLGSRPIVGVTAPELLAVLRRIESRDALESAHRARQTCGQVFRYAIATGRAERDPAADLRGALAPFKTVHRAAIIEPKAFGALLRAIDGYSGGLVTRCALQFAPLVFVRPGELRHAEWAEIDLDAAEWRIPAAKMKMRADHLVPLSAQAVAVLRELQSLTGAGRYCFPSDRTRDRPMSENTVNAALRRMGYDKATMTGHGFRAAASSLLNEQGWPADVIERQLAHTERNKVRAAYNRAEHLPERRRMMAAWADYLDSLKADQGKVVPIRRAV